MTSSSNKSGFALFTLAIVLAVAGILLVAMLPQKSDRIKQKLNETTRRLKTVQDAIGLYYETHSDKYPCPASRTKLTSDSTFGNAETCYSSGCAAVTGTVCSGAVNIGTVPTRTLGLSDEYMLDAWGNRLNYAIDVNKTAGGNGTSSLVVKDLTWSTARTLSYYLFSSGPNGKGAFNLAGNRVGACTAIAAPYSTPPYDYENCDDDANFIDDTWQIAGSTKNYDDISLTSKLAKIKCPAEVAGCTLWLDAEDTDGDGDSGNEPADNTTLQTWVDKSGKSGNATQATAGRRPSYYSSTSPIGGKPYIKLGPNSDAYSNKYYNVFTGSNIIGNEATVFIVYRPPQAGTTGNLFTFTGSASYNSALSLNGFPSHYSILYAGNSTLNYPIGSTGYGRAQLLTSAWKGGDIVNGYINGQLYGSMTSSGASAYGTNNFILGSYSGWNPDGVTSLYSQASPQGDVAEVAVYNSKLSDSSRKALECYFDTKYSLGISHCSLESSCPAPESPSCPDGISGCKTWLSGTHTTRILKSSGSAVSVDGDAVQLWCDASGNGNNAVALGSPTFSKDLYSSGHHAINFSNGGMLIPKLTTSPAYTIFMVVRPGATLSSYQTPSGGQGTPGQSFGTFSYLADMNEYSFKTGNASQEFTPAGTFTANTPALLTVSSVGTASSVYKTFINGSQIQEDSIGGYTNATDRWGVSLGGPKFDGTIAEYVYYDSVLSDSDRKAVEAEISSRWGMNYQHDTSISSSCPTPPASCPAGIDCNYWFDAKTSGTVLKDSGATAGDSEVAKLWCDSSGKGNHAVAFKAPIYKVDAFGTGYNAVQTGSGKGGFIAPYYADTPSYTNFLVYRQSGLWYEVIASSTAGGNATNKAWMINGIPSNFASYGYFSSPIYSSIAANQNYIVTQYKDTGPSYTHGFNVNAVSAGTNTASYTTTYTKWGVGLGLTGYTGYTGNIGEFISYPSKLTASQIAEVECYLADKWGMCSNISTSNYCDSYNSDTYCVGTTANP